MGSMGGHLNHSRRRDEAEEVIAWRCHVLERAGFNIDLADELARNRRVDLHDLLTLVDRGCPPHLAARILAPL